MEALKIAKLSSGFKEISDDLYKTAYKEAWSKESMAGHEAEARTTEYLGSKLVKPLQNGSFLVYDFYKDDTGAWWYQNRVLLENGELISMEQHIFGSKVRKFRNRAERKRGGEVQYG